MSLDMRTTGEIINEHIKKRKMTQKEVGQLYGVEQSFISNIVNNRNKMPADMYEKFIKDFNISIKDQSAIKSFEEFRDIPKKWKLKFYDQEQKIKELESRIKELEYLEKIKEAVSATALENLGKK